MKRIYYAFMPETYSRAGGVWWYRDIASHELKGWVDDLMPVATHIKISDTFPAHDAMQIKPPSTSLTIK